MTLRGVDSVENWWWLRWWPVVARRRGGSRPTTVEKVWMVGGETPGVVPVGGITHIIGPRFTGISPPCEHGSVGRPEGELTGTAHAEGAALGLRSVVSAAALFLGASDASSGAEFHGLPFPCVVMVGFRWRRMLTFGIGFVGLVVAAPYAQADARRHARPRRPCGWMRGTSVTGP